MSIARRMQHRNRQSAVTGTEGIPDQSGSSILTADDETVIGRLTFIMSRMVELSDKDNPMIRVMQRTGRDMLRSLGEKVREGAMSEEFIRGKLEEFANAFTWANDAPLVITPRLSDIPDEVPEEWTGQE